MTTLIAFLSSISPSSPESSVRLLGEDSSTQPLEYFHISLTFLNTMAVAAIAVLGLIHQRKLAKRAEIKSDQVALRSKYEEIFLHVSARTAKIVNRTKLLGEWGLSSKPASEIIKNLSELDALDDVNDYQYELYMYSSAYISDSSEVFVSYFLAYNNLVREIDEFVRACKASGDGNVDMMTVKSVCASSIRLMDASSSLQICVVNAIRETVGKNKIEKDDLDALLISPRSPHAKAGDAV